YQYDRDRQLTGEARPDGKLVALAYDAASRLTTQTIDTGTITRSYDVADHLTQIGAPGDIASSFSYDGFLLTSDTATGAVVGSIGRAYDTSLRLVGLSLGGVTINQAFDADNLLVAAGALTLTRDPQQGLVSSTTLSAITTTLTRNSFGEIAGMQAL